MLKQVSQCPINELPGSEHSGRGAARRQGGGCSAPTSQAARSQREISVLGRASGWVVVEKDAVTPNAVIKARRHPRLDEALADAARALTAAGLLPDYASDIAIPGRPAAPSATADFVWTVTIKSKPEGDER